MSRTDAWPGFLPRSGGLPGIAGTLCARRRITGDPIEPGDPRNLLVQRPSGRVRPGTHGTGWGLARTDRWQHSVANFFDNIRFRWCFVNDLLQGKLAPADPTSGASRQHNGWSGSASWTGCGWGSRSTTRLGQTSGVARTPAVPRSAVFARQPAPTLSARLATRLRPSSLVCPLLLHHRSAGHGDGHYRSQMLDEVSEASGRRRLLRLRARRLRPATRRPGGGPYADERGRAGRAVLLDENAE